MAEATGIKVQSAEREKRRLVSVTSLNRCIINCAEYALCPTAALEVAS